MIVLSLNSLWQPFQKKPSEFRMTINYFRLITKLFAFLGYEPTTIQKAANYSSKNSLVLTYEITAENDVILDDLDRIECPLTLFVKTTCFLSKYTQGYEEHSTQNIEKTDFCGKLKQKMTKNWEIGLAGSDLLDLTTMNQAQQVAYLLRAKSFFFEKFGFNPTTFLYPFGAYDASTVSILRQLNFSAGLTSIEGFNTLDQDSIDNFHLKRIFTHGSRLESLGKIIKFSLRNLSSESSLESFTESLARFPST